MTEIQPDAPKQKSNLHIQLGQLTVASRQELVELWIKQYKHAPPKGIQRGLLERAATYKLQSKRYGGLNTNTHRALIALANGSDLNTKASPSALTSGTKLIREWHGKTYQVEVTDNGFLWQEKSYKSLSAIAQAITGAKWSGPRFFGLKP